ncbi:unnamed protein product [Rotaria sp. Silwood2]|nr:unnamed protein product [Rotaria sp. Silwood2]CAF4008245.1 unnamed protein product [Rotaria sp. Silwood2]CAF4203101.1 unnamed protein product [Rotaria sp. Silwood2]
MGMKSNLRKCRQLQRKNKRITQRKANQDFLLSDLHSVVTDKNRLARSSIRSQLIDDFNCNSPEDNDYENYLEEDREESEIQAYIDSQWSEIYEAINIGNAGLLESIVPPINIYNGTKKYWSDELYSQQCWHTTDILSRTINLERTSCIRVLLDKVYSGDLDPAIVHGDFHLYRTPLAYACQEGDLNLVRELVECAQMQDIFDIVELLLSYIHGNIATNHDNFTPMMLAAHHDLRPIVDLLFQILPLDRAADDLLQLACRYTIDHNMQNHDMALYFFEQGLNGNSTPYHLIREKVYEFCHECQTLDQLEFIQDDENTCFTHQ